MRIGLRPDPDRADALGPMLAQQERAAEQERVAAEAFDAQDPLPLRTAAALPAFPTTALPAPVAAMVAGVAEATQTDPAMAGTTALAVLAACAGGRVEIEPRAGWREVLSLYTVTVAAPGERKSAVQAAMVAPLHVAERTLAAQGIAERLEAETERAVADRLASDARTKAAAGKDQQEREQLTADAISFATAAAEIAVPAIPRMVADDVTPEAIGTLLAEQGGRLAVISTEGGIFDVMAGRYSNIPNLDVWLKGHSGDSLRIDRKGRPPEFITRPALTLSLMIQPTVLQTIGGVRTFRGRGLLARFLYVHPTSRVGTRDPRAAAVPEDILELYADTVQQLARSLDGWRSDPLILRLDPAAATFVVDQLGRLEPHLAPGGALSTLADWASKYVGAVCRIAGLLHVALHTEPRNHLVSVETLQRAEQLGRYYLASAVNAFAAIGADPVTEDAIYLLDRLRDAGEARVTLRDMLRLAQRFQSKAELEPAVERLLDRGWLARLPEPSDATPSRGRPPSPTYVIHPSNRRNG